MEERSGINDLQFSPLDINWIANNASGLHGGHDANQHYIMFPGGYGIDSKPTPVPQWMYCQQTSQNYVQFLAEKQYPQIQKQISCNISAQVPSWGLADPSQSKQNWNEECSHAFQAYSGPGADESKHSSAARRKRSREKAYAADRCRRLRISHWLDALQELVPCPKEGGKAALLDDVIDHVKCLQYQVMDLCRSRLGGESASNSFIFLEGHGHYIVQDQMFNGPLEEIMGKLIDVYPSAATELLQNRGLIVMPMNFAEGLLEPMQMLGIQGKGSFLIPK